MWTHFGWRSYVVDECYLRNVTNIHNPHNISEYQLIRRVPSSGMLCRVTFVRTDVSGERCIIGLLVTANFVLSSPILITLMMKVIHSPKYRFLQGRHGVTSQNTALLIFTAVQT
jgi:hypothetical protein